MQMLCICEINKHLLEEAAAGQTMPSFDQMWGMLKALLQRHLGYCCAQASPASEHCGHLSPVRVQSMSASQLSLFTFAFVSVSLQQGRLLSYHLICVHLQLTMQQMQVLLHQPISEHATVVLHAIVAAIRSEQ